MIVYLANTAAIVSEVEDVVRPLDNNERMRVVGIRKPKAGVETAVAPKPDGFACACRSDFEPIGRAGVCDADVAVAVNTHHFLPKLNLSPLSRKRYPSRVPPSVEAPLIAAELPTSCSKSYRSSRVR